MWTNRNRSDTKRGTPTNPFAFRSVERYHRRVRVMLLIVIGLRLLAPPGYAAEYDVILAGGRVIDGTGNPGRHADIAIKDGRITVIGRAGTNATELIDVTGLVVAPGFIDVHTHAENILALPHARNFARQGVTTLVLGNCGSSEVNVGRFFDRVEQTNVAVNVATLVGQGSVRSQVMGGSFMRPPTPDELKQMKGLVRRAMADGALGLSTGLIYLPGTFTKTDEIIELAKVVAGFGGTYTSHMRNIQSGRPRGLDGAQHFRRPTPTIVATQFQVRNVRGEPAFPGDREKLVK